jgi:hypothetical protein
MLTGGAGKEGFQRGRLLRHLLVDSDFGHAPGHFRQCLKGLLDLSMTVVQGLEFNRLDGVLHVISLNLDFVNCSDAVGDAD